MAAVLALAPEKLDPDRPLLSLGLDSLTAMELKVEIETGLGAAFPLSMLLEGCGIRELAERAAGVSARLSDTTARDVDGPHARNSPMIGSRTSSNCSGTRTNSRPTAPPITSPGPRRSARSWTSTPCDGRYGA